MSLSLDESKHRSPKTKLLESLNEVKKCLASAEVRRKSSREMQWQYKLQEEVNQAKDMPFHLGRDDIVELKSQFRRRTSAERYESDDNKKAVLKINDILRNAYEFGKRHMVAVKVCRRSCTRLEDLWG